MNVLFYVLVPIVILVILLAIQFFQSFRHRRSLSSLSSLSSPSPSPVVQHSTLTTTTSTVPITKDDESTTKNVLSVSVVEESPQSHFSKPHQHYIKTDSHPFICFVDNEQSNFKGSSSLGDHLLTILIDNDEKPVVFTDSTIFQRLSTDYPNDKELYFRWLQSTQELYGTEKIQENVQRYCLYKQTEINLGITSSHLEEIRHWIEDSLKKTTNSKCLLFLDWDRTLSCCEGIYIEPFQVSSGLTQQCFLSFLLGGKSRYKLLQTTFKEWKEKYGSNLEYYVITNNGYCTDPNDTNVTEASYFGLFLRMVRLLFGNEFPDDHLLCMTTLMKKNGEVWRTQTSSSLRKSPKIVIETIYHSVFQAPHKEK